MNTSGSNDLSYFFAVVNDVSVCLELQAKVTLAEFIETKTRCTLQETARSAQLKFSEEILLLN